MKSIIFLLASSVAVACSADPLPSAESYRNALRNHDLAVGRIRYLSYTFTSWQKTDEKEQARLAPFLVKGTVATTKIPEKSKRKVEVLIEDDRTWTYQAEEQGGKVIMAAEPEGMVMPNGAYMVVYGENGSESKGDWSLIKGLDMALGAGISDLKSLSCSIKDNSINATGADFEGNEVSALDEDGDGTPNKISVTKAVNNKYIETIRFGPLSASGKILTATRELQDSGRSLMRCEYSFNSLAEDIPAGKEVKYKWFRPGYLFIDTRVMLKGEPIHFTYAELVKLAGSNDITLADLLQISRRKAGLAAKSLGHLKGYTQTPPLIFVGVITALIGSFGIYEFRRRSTQTKQT